VQSCTFAIFVIFLRHTKTKSFDGNGLFKYIFLYFLIKTKTTVKIMFSRKFNFLTKNQIWLNKKSKFRGTLLHILEFLHPKRLFGCNFLEFLHRKWPFGCNFLEFLHPKMVFKCKFFELHKKHIIYNIVLY